MAHAESQNESTTGQRRYEGGALRAHVRVAQVDIGYPSPDVNPLRRGTHELRCGHRVVVHFGREDGFEASSFSLSRDLPDVGHTPPGQTYWDGSEPESFAFHTFPLFYCSNGAVYVGGRIG